MKVEIRVVGPLHDRELTWPDGWPPPVEGQVVDLTDGQLTVRQVIWYPEGHPDVEPADRMPFVYVIIGPTRR